jgi:hypothetical protein
MELPRTTPDQREVLYEDVRSLLSPGFLVHYVTVNGIRFALRSLNRNDSILLQHRLGGEGISDRITKSWMIASAVWMVDGQIILGDEGSKHRIYELVYNLPQRARNDLQAVAQQLMSKVSEAVARVEAFLYEGESRYMWRSNGMDMIRQGAFGHQDAVGNNAIQSLWVFFNTQEDAREQSQEEWARTRFMTSPHAPKAIKKISASDQKHDQDMKRRRQGVMDRVFYESTGVITRETKSRERLPGSPWQGLRRAETPEELQEDMRRWVEGIKDDHDHVVDGIKARIKRDVEARRAQAKTRAEAVRKALDAEGVSGGSLQPLTGDAAKKFMERLSKRIPGAKKVVEGTGHNRAYDKYLKNDPSIGNLRVDDDGRVVPGVEVDEKMAEDMLAGMKKPKDAPTGIGELQQRISDRRPTAQDLGLDED